MGYFYVIFLRFLGFYFFFEILFRHMICSGSIFGVLDFLNFFDFNVFLSNDKLIASSIDICFNILKNRLNKYDKNVVLYQVSMTQVLDQVWHRVVYGVLHGVVYGVVHGVVLVVLDLDSRTEKLTLVVL